MGANSSQPSYPGQPQLPGQEYTLGGGSSGIAVVPAYGFGYGGYGVGPAVVLGLNDTSHGRGQTYVASAPRPGYVATQTPGAPAGYPQQPYPNQTNNYPYATNMAPYPTNTAPYPPNVNPYPSNTTPNTTPNTAPYPPNTAPYSPTTAPYPPTTAPYPPTTAPYSQNTPYPPLSDLPPYSEIDGSPSAPPSQTEKQ